MSMRKDFCVFILTNGRPNRVHTYKTLMKAGYTGKVFIVIDDEDKTADQYRKKFGDKVLQFCKADMDAMIDPGDNFSGRSSTIWPRAAFWGIAKEKKCKYFIQLDDDYTCFAYRFDKFGNDQYMHIRKTCDEMFSALLDFHIKTPSVSVAMSQGGDFIGGADGRCKLLRKAMNSFVCSVDRPFMLIGRRNEDVNAYVLGSLRGNLFFTVMQAQLVQVQTQKNPGLITDSYIESGTYQKSFYTVMYAPSCCKIGVMGDPRSGDYRIHHDINWGNAAPKILRATHKKLRQDGSD